MQIKTYLPKIYDAIAAILLVIAMTIASLIFWFLLALYNKERDSKSVHQGGTKAYKDGKREGKWNITSTYILGNGNDGKTSAEGFYTQGVKDGIWTVQTPYVQCLYEYDKGVVGEEICLNNYDFTYRIFDEWGNLLEDKEGSKEECKRLYSHFGYYYYGRNLCTFESYF